MSGKQARTWESEAARTRTSCRSSPWICDRNREITSTIRMEAAIRHSKVLMRRVLGANHQGGVPASQQARQDHERELDGVAGGADQAQRPDTVFTQRAD